MQLEELCDEKLVARVAQGDHEAFRALVVRHRESVFGIAFRYLGNRSDAEEMAQETFVRLFEAAHRYRFEAKFRTYLLTITVRLCLNRRARRDRREEAYDPGSTVFSRLPSVAPNPEDAVVRDERRLAISEAVLSLPEDQRLALILFYFEELPYQTIAKMMGKPIPAVTSLLWRARERLRRDLKE